MVFVAKDIIIIKSTFGSRPFCVQCSGKVKGGMPRISKVLLMYQILPVTLKLFVMYSVKRISVIVLVVIRRGRVLAGDEVLAGAKDVVVAQRPMIAKLILYRHIFIWSSCK